MKTRGLDHYERRAIHDIQAWVDGDRGPLQRLAGGLGARAEQASRPLERALQEALRDTRAAEALDTALERSAEALSRFMAATTPIGPALEAYGVEDVNGIAKLHLREIDAQLAGVRGRHRRTFLAMGAAEGAASFAGTPAAVAAFAASIPAMQAASLRAISDLSRHAGFDPSDFAERRFVAEVAMHTLEVGGRRHTESVNHLLGLGQQVAARQTLDQLQQYAIMGALRDQARRFGIALTRRRVGALLPLLGAAVGAGFNALHADRLLTGGSMLFRARHLARQHDLDLAELISRPAQTV